MKRTIPVLLILAATRVALAQSIDPLRFFPHHRGDIWEYWDSLGDSLQNKIIVDSLDLDGRYVLVTTDVDRVILDTSLFRVYWHNLNYLRYQLDADSGAAWIVQQ